MRHVKHTGGQPTPLNCFEDSRLELVREPRVHGTGFLSLALQCLEIVETTLSSNLALELFEAVEGHPCGIGPWTVRGLQGWNKVGGGGR